MEKQMISLALAFLRQRPRSAASTLERHDLQDVVDFLATVPPSYGSAVVKCMIPHFAARVCERLPLPTTANLLSGLDPNQLSNILRYVDKTSRNGLLEGLPSRTKRSCNSLLSYSKNAIGAWAVPQSDSLPSDCTATDALKAYANLGSKTDSAFLYVVGEGNVLRGRIHISDILSAGGNQSVDSLCDDNCPRLRASTPVATALLSDIWMQADVVPVINNRDHFVGSLRHLDLRKASSQLTASPQSSVGGSMENNISAYGESLLATFQAMGDILEADTRA